MNGHKETSALESLTQKLVQDVRVLNDYYSRNVQTAPSFERDAAAASIPEKAPLEVKVARDAAMDHALEIFDLLSGPSKLLSNLTVSVSVPSPTLVSSSSKT